MKFVEFFGYVIEILLDRLDFLNSLEKRKKWKNLPRLKIFWVRFLENIYTWGAQGQMTQLKLIVNSLPRDLAEFSFFLIIGFTAGSMGLI